LNPVAHTYSISGTNSVTLTIVAGGVTNSITRSNYITVSAPSTPPQITGITVTGVNIVMTGTNGVPGGTYVLCSSTNAALSPLSLWTPVSTNQFGADGNFTNTIPVSPSIPQEFFVLKLQ
jgi:PKD repeat protein